MADSRHIGKVIKSTRNHYLVQLKNKILTCTIRGRLAGGDAGESFSLKVGDNVRVSVVAEAEAVIEEVLPRYSKLSRTVEGKAYREHIIAANVDQMVIIMSAKSPAFKPGLMDRYLVIAEKNRLKGAVCINKIDLSRPEEFADYAKWYPHLEYDLFFTSAFTGQGIGELKELLQGKVSVLVGHSGVGKSSLLKKIEPALELEVAEISDKTRKGRHTTSHVELFPLTSG
ncbi:MAG: ribosome small subunit-dependent GTPase A, partial [Calditrichia bacterium]